MIDAKVVYNIFLDSMFNKDELTDDGYPIDESKLVKVSGIVHNIGFNKDRLESHRYKVIEYLSNTSLETDEGGTSFISLPFDRVVDSQWGEQLNAEQLMLIGIGLGIIEYCLPRQLWSICPGGVPFIRYTENFINSRRK